MATRVRLTPSVLVVNDALDEREMYARTLRASGYQAIEAATFTAAYQIATTNKLDIVVTDVRIAGSISGGLELTRRLRNDARTSTVPIIVLTNVSRPQDGDIALKAGADTVLEKPVPGSTLRAEILRLLARSWPFLSGAAHKPQRSDPRRRQAESSDASGAAEGPAHSPEAPDPLSARPMQSRRRASLESPCPACGAALAYRDRCPILALQPVAPIDRNRRERLQYVAGWFCTNPSCEYCELSSVIA
jgi:two-component system cell cycle response regulator DivK